MNYFEVIGCIFGLLGALLLALNNRYSGFGFYAFLVSNLAWIGYAIVQSVGGLTIQHIGFSITSLVGIYRWRAGKASTQYLDEPQSRDR
ncbi:hypothetical protein ACFQAT_28515 [Undibacterium arcticum]|uniref:Nicotinamide riboside transporter PnuC n=1 Tax=Undibacterium arcticum TaxID=1762892 RepID=A0ABV7FB94_9BURK